MSSTRWLLAFAPLALIAACGGQSFTEGDDDSSGGASAGKAGSGSGGSGKAGSGNAGTSSGGTGNGGSGFAGNGGSGFAGSGGSGFAGSGTGGSVCCAAAPTCPSGERPVPSSEYCAPGGACHSVSVCCSTIWCTSDLVQCDAFPTCDPLDTALTGPCPPGMPCYSRTLCGQTIWCLDQDQLCEPETAHNRRYVATDCSGLDWECPTPQTKSFANECGCGCQQADECPAHLGCVNLMPPPEEAEARPGAGGASSSGVPNPGGGSGVAAGPPCLAEDLARCPYSATY